MIEKLLTVLVLSSFLVYVDSNLICIAESWRTNSVRCELLGTQISELKEIIVYGNRQNTKVINLYMKGCKLRFMSPTVFSNTPDVQILDLSQNFIETLDENIFNSLGELRALNLSYNMIETIPTDLFKPLKKLRDLDLSGNTLSIYSNDGIFDGLINLRSLDISNNFEVSIVPDLFRGLSLKSLSLSNTKIVFPDTYALEQPNLVYLDISLNFNLLSTRILYNVLQTCTHLVEVNINTANLEAINHDAFKDNVRLRIINLSKNKLTYIDAEVFSRNTALLLLNLSSNSLEKLPNHLFRKNGEMIELNLSDNKINSLGVNTFDALIKLQVLDLSNNQIGVLQNGIFSKNIELVVLNLSGNKIKTLNSFIFGNKPKLNTINLGNNALEKFSYDVIKDMRNLFSLFLDNNKLSSIPFEVLSSRLSHIFLSCNEFVSLPQDTFTRMQTENFKLLSLNGNPWDCGCLNYLLSTVKTDNTEINANFLDGQEIACVVGSSYNICNATQSRQDYQEWLQAHRFSSNACISKK